mmetsp:Transcript_122497/g.352001  ORF Transcript_122497/g.352001 Transcript_122497/m.352001 type:complete len:152 (+) Transcript_122497:3-458(+)
MAPPVGRSDREASMFVENPAEAVAEKFPSNPSMQQQVGWFGHRNYPKVVVGMSDMNIVGLPHTAMSPSIPFPPGLRGVLCGVPGEQDIGLRGQRKAWSASGTLDDDGGRGALRPRVAHVSLDRLGPWLRQPGEVPPACFAPAEDFAWPISL